MIKAVIYYFSGSGNSEWVAQEAKSCLIKNDYEVELINIENGLQPDKVNEAALVGFISPVYGFGLPNIFVKLLYSLPKVKNKKSFILSVPAGHEGIAIVQNWAILKFKGYDIIKAICVYMPDTWVLIMNAPSEDKFKEALQKSKDKIALIIQEIVDNKRSIALAHPVNLVLLGLVYFIFYYLGRQHGGKSFYTTNKCVKCKICMKECPSKTIKWKNNKPYWAFGCEQCFRCINSCPVDAIEFSGTSIILGMLLLFYAAFPYNFIPENIKNSLNIISPLPQLLIWAIVIIIFLWLIQLIINYMPFLAWSWTIKRIRYKFFVKNRAGYINK